MLNQRKGHIVDGRIRSIVSPVPSSAIKFVNFRLVTWCLIKQYYHVAEKIAAIRYQTMTIENKLRKAAVIIKVCGIAIAP
jgi:hypothetical protein